MTERGLLDEFKGAKINETVRQSAKILSPSKVGEITCIEDLKSMDLKLRVEKLKNV